ncbi:NAD binding domain of 6-phosphogluconate dehydrogenase family protein [Mycobacterium avium subsp. avium 2285 (R)]|nr:NAD binding domain of 6-phosphogluconate dehydrogenase family protein [Mycobacterium avium subsp. avium 2285 (R)]
MIGFIGAGRIGEPMIERLIDAGRTVTSYARRPEVADRLAAKGSAVASSIADLAAISDVVIMCLFDDGQLRDVCAGTGGLIANLKPGSVVVSHTTGSVATLEALAAQSQGTASWLDAPFSGTADDVRASTLTVLLGGDSDARATATPALRTYAGRLIVTGGLGTALRTKLVNNLLFAANAQLAGAAARLGVQLGLSYQSTLDAIMACSGSSQAAAHLGAAGSTEQFDAMVSDVLTKDVTAALEMAAEHGVDAGVLADTALSGPLRLRP